MSWFEKILPERIKTQSRSRSVPEGLWIQCSACAAQLFRKDLDRNLKVCPQCDHHMRLSARERLEVFLDEPGDEIGAEVEPDDPLKFRDSKRYKDRLSQAQKKSGERDALIAMRGTLDSLPVVAAAFDFGFMGGSMASVVGERLCQAANVAARQRCPLVLFTASGGARMQEGLHSLLQMAKTSAALAQLAEQRLPYISVLTDPTTGGVSASVAMLGDLNIAEPHALIGFAGPRVIEQTVRETLPEGFQRAEFLLDHGQLDAIVDRRELREFVAKVLRRLMAAETKAASNPSSDTA